jgi:hypothetical protein
MLAIITFSFVIYMFPGMWGAPIKAQWVISTTKQFDLIFKKLFVKPLKHPAIKQILMNQLSYAINPNILIFFIYLMD